MKTIEQKRAGNALARLKQLTNESETFRKRYRSYVDRLGPAIVMNGLGQAVAVELAAAGDNPQSDDRRAHKALYCSVQSWLCREEGVYSPGADLLQVIVDNDETHYLHAQAEALAWLDWHKKFCRAYFPAEDQDSS